MVQRDRQTQMILITNIKQREVSK